MHGPQTIVSFWLEVSTPPSRTENDAIFCQLSKRNGRHRGVRLRANRLPVEGLAALAAFIATFTVSLLV